MNGLWGPVLTAMATPFDEEGCVDSEGAARLCRHLLDHGSDGLVVAATTGEGAVLDEGERVALWDVCLQAVGDRAAVWASVGTNDTLASARLARIAAGRGVHGLLVVTPYYNRPPQAALYRHFATIAEATELPIMLYNVPSRTGVNMTAETTLRLAHDVPSIRALKEAHPDLGQVADLIAGRPDGFRVFSGDDAATFPMVALGADGVVSVASHVVGPAIAAMLASLGAGDHRQAALLHLEILPVVRALFATTSPILLKAALALLGLPAGRPRPPLLAADADEIRALATALIRAKHITAAAGVRLPPA